MQHHSQISPTYGYVFSYGKGLSVINSMGLDWKDWGVTHGDELIYMFNSTLYDSLKESSGDDFRMVSFLTEVWSNFAATG